VIENVSLTIRQGDIIAVLGPNGAGKTTLVKHAIGLLRPTQGRVLLRGQDTKDLSVAQMARTVGYVFQSPRHMLFAPTVLEELAYGPKNLGQKQSDIEENSRQALQVIDLIEDAKRPPLSLSFGQQKRVSIASVLAMRSPVLVMDEPTAGQDYAHYMSFMDAVVGLGTAVDKPYSFGAIIFITHDVDLAVCYANRVLLLGGKQVVADGSPAQVLADFDRLRRSRVLPTSLLQANLENLNRTGRFMRAEALAGVVGNGR
jgi:energy-coupling factor transport system ATP-binding protein